MCFNRGEHHQHTGEDEIHTREKYLKAHQYTGGREEAQVYGPLRDSRKVGLCSINNNQLHSVSGDSQQATEVKLERIEDLSIWLTKEHEERCQRPSMVKKWHIFLYHFLKQ